MNNFIINDKTPKNLDFDYNNPCKLSLYGSFDKIQIEFFDFSKVFNPYIICDYAIKIVHDKNNNCYNIVNTREPIDFSNIKIYLSNEGKYIIEHNPTFDIKHIDCMSIKNAKDIKNLNICVGELNIENSNIKNFNTDITKSMLWNLEINKSNIENLHYPLNCSLSIYNSHITNIQGIDSDYYHSTSHIINKSDINTINANIFKAEISESIIKKMDIKSGKIYFLDSDIGKINMEYGDIIIRNYCKLNEDIIVEKGDIILSVLDYYTKKYFSNKTIIKDKKTNKKLIKAKARDFIGLDEDGLYVW